MQAPLVRYGQPLHKKTRKHTHNQSQTPPDTTHPHPPPAPLSLAASNPASCSKHETTDSSPSRSATSRSSGSTLPTGAPLALVEAAFITAMSGIRLIVRAGDLRAVSYSPHTCGGRGLARLRLTASLASAVLEARRRLSCFSPGTSVDVWRTPEERRYVTATAAGALQPGRADAAATWRSGAPTSTTLQPAAPTFHPPGTAYYQPQPLTNTSASAATAVRAAAAHATAAATAPTPTPSLPLPTPPPGSLPPAPPLLHSPPPPPPLPLLLYSPPPPTSLPAPLPLPLMPLTRLPLPPRPPSLHTRTR